MQAQKRATGVCQHVPSFLNGLQILPLFQEIRVITVLDFVTTPAVTVPRGATTTTTLVRGRTMVTATRTTCGRLHLTVVTIITGTSLRVRSTRITTIPEMPFRAAVSWCSAAGVFLYDKCIYGLNF